MTVGKMTADIDFAQEELDKIHDVYLIVDELYEFMTLQGFESLYDSISEVWTKEEIENFCILLDALRNNNIQLTIEKKEEQKIMEFNKELIDEIVTDATDAIIKILESTSLTDEEEQEVWRLIASNCYDFIDSIENDMEE